MGYDLVTLGETMVRLTPPAGERLEQATQFDIEIGGAESNLAVALARLGKRVAWLSRLPENPLGTQTVRALRQHGVDTSWVVWTKQGRMGLYFLEYGSPPRSVRLWYDRAGSAASQMTPDDLPLEAIASARWLHLTGITPALSDSCAETVRAALEHARAHQVTVSFDINYRSLLWSREEAASALEPLCLQADYTIGALRDTCNLFSTEDKAESAVRDLQERWSGTVVLTEGDAGVIAYDGETLERAQAIPATVVDRLGAGDAFAAGLICRLLEAASLGEALRFGTALAALKLTIPGDLALTSRDEVEELIASGGAGVQR